MPWTGKNGPSSHRKGVSREALEMAITAAVKKSDPQCEPFVGVLIEHHAPGSREDTNWAIKGIRFGRAARDKCSAALVAVIDEMQGAFELRQDAAPAKPAIGRRRRRSS
ncbi:hypothetical protein SAMN05443248_1782 [Bradyrhizobium erythrophlei]|uniref:Uncharacterized protein n=2 Tax=Bradyrhizobium erythrophlei TaxID=1437360 RepID=A0A1M5KD43_9BRAD|nr:hypothetical protein SAMN05443248_1782 [Bradyrhizobium erythrophlei]